MIYVITGHLGSGKSLLAIRIAHDYLQAGKRVASNITLNLDRMPGGDKSKVTATKLPYIPNESHLEALGQGYEGPYDEDKFGLIILDEAGKWLNTRDWADKERRGLFSWLTHARKKGWDLALIVQDFEALDAQIRRSITEVYVKCQRLDRFKVPYLPIRLPRYYVGTGRYGGPDGVKFKTWHASGEDYFAAYDTREAVRQEVTWTETGETVDMRAPYTMLSGWHLRGRYIPKRPPLPVFATAVVKWTLIALCGWIARYRGTGAAWRRDFELLFPRTGKSPYDVAT